MATTSNSYTGNNSTVDFAFTFPYLNSSDIKVSVDEVVQTLTTHYTLHNATTIRFGTAPATGKAIKIYRDTASAELAATFYPGSAIRSGDLNDNYTQNLYVTQEAENDSTEALSNSRVLESGAYVSAITKATTAISTANTASTNATNAVNTANTASTNATNAVNTANSASTTATNASNSVGDKIDQDGSVAMEANLAMGTNKITGLGDPTADQDAATKKHVSDNYYNKTDADSRFYNLASTEEIQSGETWSAADNKIATTSAIDNRIIDLVDDVGGFVPIANETSFPNANPDVNNGAGTLVSIKALSTNYTSNGSGVISVSNGTVGNSTVTINGAENSTTYNSGFGMIVETTTTLNTYTFHRLVPKATEVTTVASKATEIGRLGTAAAVEDLGILGTTDVVADMALLGTSDCVADMAILGTSDVVSDLEACANNATNINTNASNIGNINAVAGQIVHAEDLGLITESLTTESGNNINTVADNINDINSFSDIYKVAGSQPGSPSGGDLWYDSSVPILKYYNGSSWNNISDGGIGNLIEDHTPELYAALDCNDKNLTEVATISGTNLQIDFGTL